METTATISSALGTASAGLTERVRGRAALGMRWILHVPLPAKLIGANVTVAVCALAAALFIHRAGGSTASLIVALSVGLLIGTTVNVLLTRLALRPIREIERTITRLWHGETGVRVARSAVGDLELDQIGQTMNALLDRLDRDRTHMRDLAADIVHAEDREHDRIARQLRDSISQSLASVTYLLAAVSSDCSDHDLRLRLTGIRTLACEVLDDIDVLSHGVHPHVLNDLGLFAGLKTLARDLSTPDVPVGAHMVAGAEAELKGLGRETASALFRVAQEAVQNALRHAHAGFVAVSVGVADQRLSVRVRDDGDGFDMREAEERRPRMGLFRMRQRAALVNAMLSIDTAPGRGTTVTVTMPMGVATFPC